VAGARIPYPAHPLASSPLPPLLPYYCAATPLCCDFSPDSLRRWSTFTADNTGMPLRFLHDRRYHLSERNTVTECNSAHLADIFTTSNYPFRVYSRREQPTERGTVNVRELGAARRNRCPSCEPFAASPSEGSGRNTSLMYDMLPSVQKYGCKSPFICRF